jgi:hypothetical protein
MCRKYSTYIPHYFGKHAPDVSIILQQSSQHYSSALLSIFSSELQLHVLKKKSDSFAPRKLTLTYFKHVYGCPEGKSKIQKPHASCTIWRKVNLERRNIKLLLLSSTLLLGLLIAVIVGYGFLR